MATYEITLTYPDQTFDRITRAFLGSVIASSHSTLDGFRSAGTGVALTFVVERAPDKDAACRMASQRAGGIWPNFNGQLTGVELLDRDDVSSV